MVSKDETETIEQIIARFDNKDEKTGEYLPMYFKSIAGGGELVHRSDRQNDQTSGCGIQTKPNRDAAINHQLKTISNAIGSNPCTTTNDTLVEGKWSMGEVSGSAKNDYKITGCEQMVVTAANLANTAYTSQCSTDTTSDTTETVVVTMAAAVINVSGSKIKGDVVNNVNTTQTVVVSKTVSMQMTNEMKASAESAAEAILKNVMAAEKGFMAGNPNGQKVGGLHNSENFASTLQDVKKSIITNFKLMSTTGVTATIIVSDSTVGGSVINNVNTDVNVKAMLVSDIILKSIFENKNVQKATSAIETEQKAKTIGFDKIVDTIGNVITAVAAEIAGVAKAYAMIIPIVLAVLGIGVVGGVGVRVRSNWSRIGRIRMGPLLSRLLLLIGVCLLVVGIIDVTTTDGSPYPGVLAALEKDLKNNLSPPTKKKLKEALKTSNVGGENGVNATPPHFHSVEDQKAFLDWFGKWIRENSDDEEEFKNIKEKIGKGDDMWSAFQPPATIWYFVSGGVLVGLATLLALYINRTTHTLVLFHPEPVVGTSTTDANSAETDQAMSIGPETGWSGVEKAEWESVAGTGVDMTDVADTVGMVDTRFSQRSQTKNPTRDTSK